MSQSALFVLLALMVAGVATAATMEMHARPEAVEQDGSTGHSIMHSATVHVQSKAPHPRLRAHTRRLTKVTPQMASSSAHKAHQHHKHHKHQQVQKKVTPQMTPGRGHVAQRVTATAPNVTHQAGPLNSTSLRTMMSFKAEIMGSTDFHSQSGKLAKLLHCGSVKQATACTSIVDEALFCFAFAEEFKRFSQLDGAAAVQKQCAHIDTRHLMIPEGFIKFSAHPPPSNVTHAAPAQKSPPTSREGKINANIDRQAKKLSEVVGCRHMKRASACDEYMHQTAFCLVFAHKMHSFASFPGFDEQSQQCSRMNFENPKKLFDVVQAKTSGPVLMQVDASAERGPEDALAKEMTHDLEMNFNKIAPFGKEDTAKELQDHAAKTQDTLVDAVENAEVAEIKRAVFRALTRLRAATIKEFDTIARLETQAIDAYNDAHHYRAENPLAHLHEDEAPVETDKLKSFH